MRKCPVCNSAHRRLIMEHYNSENWTAYLCTCGMVYLDSDTVSEERLNEYYRKVYTSDDGPVADIRLGHLARFVAETCQSPVLDIGGTDMKLAGLLSGMIVDVSGAGDKPSKKYQTIVLSHTLEHVYNMRRMIETIIAHLNPGGKVVVEVPIWGNQKELTAYDYHLQHCNKFTPEKLRELFENAGFEVTLSEPLPDYIEYQCWRLVAILRSGVKKNDLTWPVIPTTMT